MKPWLKWIMISFAGLFTLGVIIQLFGGKGASTTSTPIETVQKPHGLEVTPEELLEGIAKTSQSTLTDAGGRTVEWSNHSITRRDSAGYVVGSAFILHGPVNDAYRTGAARLNLWMSNVLGTENATKVQQDIANAMSTNKGTGEWNTSKIKLSYVANSANGYLFVGMIPK